MSDARFNRGWFTGTPTDPFTGGWFSGSTPPPVGVGSNNYIITRGMGGWLLVTRGYGQEPSVPVPTIGNGVYVVSGTNGLTIDIVIKEGLVYFVYKDSANSFTAPINVSASAVTGNWNLFKVTRSGRVLTLSFNGVDIYSTTLVFTVATVSGSHNLSPNKASKLFDVRAIAQAITQSAFQYYCENLRTYTGDALLPLNDIPLIPSTPTIVAPTVTPPPSSYTFCLDGGNFYGRAYISSGVAYLFIHDGIGDHTITLPIDSSAFSNWNFLKLTRKDNVLAIICNGTSVYSATLSSVLPIGNNFYVGKGMTQGLFDVRVVNQAIQDDAFQYYQENIQTYNGDAVLPGVM